MHYLDALDDNRGPLSIGPIIKYAGGKTRLLPELVARMPKKFNRYFEPFAGGAAMFFKIRPDYAVLGDTNADLINMYKAVGRDVEAVVRNVRRHTLAHGKRYYYKMRDDWNHRSVHTWSDATRAAAFIYLNRTCFNGLWRVNRRGEFNVPMGDYDRPLDGVTTSIRIASERLFRARVVHSSYQELFEDAQPGDFVYADPPYDPISETARFTAYNAGGFDRDAQRELARAALALVGRGVHVMLSNSDTPFIRRLYSGLGFQVERVMCPRSINSDPKARKGIAEVIITCERPSATKVTRRRHRAADATAQTC